MWLGDGGRQRTKSWRIDRGLFTNRAPDSDTEPRWGQTGVERGVEEERGAPRGRCLTPQGLASRGSQPWAWKPGRGLAPPVHLSAEIRAQAQWEQSKDPRLRRVRLEVETDSAPDGA